MRRGSWILAISGMMAFHQSGFAADPVVDQPAGKSAAGSVKISSKKPEKKAAKPKNYYKDLFAEENADEAVATAKRPSSAPATKAADLFDDGDDLPSDRKPKTVEPGSGAGFDSDETTPTVTQSTNPMAEKPGLTTGNRIKVNAKVAQAGFDSAGEKKEKIQQVRSDGRPKTAPPMAGADKNARKTIKTASAANDPIFDLQEDPFASDEAPAPPKTKPTTATNVVKAGPQTSQVTLEWVKRGDFNVGQECRADLLVRNGGATDVQRVAIEGFFPTNVRLISADPTPASATDCLTWEFDRLEAGSEQRISVVLIPSKRGEIEATAHVRFTNETSSAFAVHEPLLKVAFKQSSREVMLGDPVSQMITINNPGTGTAHDVKIEAKLSEGLEHPTREDHLIIDVGPLGPGEVRTYRLGLTAAKGGMQSIGIVATSSSDVSATDSVKFDVVAPSLKVAIEGPSLRYKGRNAKYTLTITNDGNLVNENVRVTQAISEGFKFVSADRNGKFDASINSVQWFIGRLEPGDTEQVTCELNALQIGEFAHKVQVISDAGVQSESKIDTRVDGIASLTMELVDLDDPIEVGSETAYEIRVKNDGSKTATGVIVACELPSGMQLLSAKAAVDHAVDGKFLNFSPIERIAPGEQITLRLHMKVNREGSHRLRTRLTGGGLQEPMILEEVTRAYSDGSN